MFADKVNIIETRIVFLRFILHLILHC